MKRPYKGLVSEPNKAPGSGKLQPSNSTNREPTKRVGLPSINKINEKVPQQPQEEYTQQNYVDQALGNLFHQYFIINGYMKTLECFQKEQGQGSTKSQSQQFRRLLLQSFDKGDKELFFKVFNKYTPLHIRMKDERTTKLEFYLNIYFLIFKVHPSNKANGNKRKSTIDPETRQSFKKYLKSKGEALANTSQFLPYYALAYIEPFENPEFKELFSDEWIDELREKVVNFAECLYPHQKPLLSQIYESYVQKSMKETNNNQTSSLKEFGLMAKRNEEIEALQQHNEEMQNYIKTLTDKYWEFQSNFKKFGQNTKNTLIESQRKWFQLTQEIFMMAAKALALAESNNESPQEREAELNRIRTRIERYQGFINTNIDDLISQDVDFSMFERPSVSVENQVEHEAVEPRGNAFICLDIRKIKETFAGQNVPEIIALLQALKQRIRTSQGINLKRQVVIELALFDIFGAKQQGQPLLNKLLFADPGVSQEMGKLVSTLANDYYGRTYLFHAVGPLIKAMKEEKGDTVLRESLIVTFEFMSLRRKGQLSMINNGFVEWIVNILKSQRDTLGEDKLGYLTALLMNLSFRKQGLDKCQEIRDELMMNIIQLFEHKNMDIQSYINGALYSVLSRKSFREKAKEHGLSDLIDYQINNGASVDVTQLNYVKQMLNKEDDDQEELHDETDMEDLEDGGDDLDDIDEEPLSANNFGNDAEDNEETNVERLLVESYTLAGPEIINHMVAISREVDESLKRRQVSFIRNQGSQDRPSSMMRPLMRNRSNISSNRGGSASNRMLPSQLRQRVRPYVQGQEQIAPVSPMSRESSLNNSQVPRPMRQIEVHPQYKQVFLPRNQIVRTPPHSDS